MPTITRTLTTEAPVDAVFAYLADFSNAPAWDPGTESSVARDGAGPRVGQVYDLVVVWGDRRLPMTYEVTAFEENRSITLVGDGSTTRAIDTMTFAPVPDGGCAVTYNADIRLKGVLRLAEPFLRSRFATLGDEAEKGIREALDRLATSG